MKIERQLRALTITIVSDEPFDRQIYFPNEHAVCVLLDNCTHLRHDLMHFNLIAVMDVEKTIDLSVACTEIRVRRIVSKLCVFNQKPQYVDTESSTPRSNQNRIASYIALRTDWLRQFRSGCSRRKLCR